MDLREQIGQRLVTGFPGTELTEDFRRMVREYKISNVILFRENITDCAQLKQLCGEIQALVRRETGHGAFITYPVPAARTGASSGNDVPAHHDGAAAGADGL